MPAVIQISRPAARRRVLLGSAASCLFLGAPMVQAGAGKRLILLDPGHGGHDPGATSGAGTLEKAVTLAAALALRDTLAGMTDYDVALTRDRDRFLAPEDRAAIAMERGASLFLSLHADKTADPAIRGASVYTLSARASDPETEALAARENGHGNAAAPNQAPEVSAILNSLASRENRTVSARVAGRILTGLEGEVPLLFSPRRRANFIVLHAAGIPSVLMEMGFLSNPADEAALKDPAHRTRLARAVARAIDGWFAGGMDREQPA